MLTLLTNPLLYLAVGGILALLVVSLKSIISIGPTNGATGRQG